MNPKTLCVTLALAATCAARDSEPIEIPATGGRLILPMSGLAVNFPAQPDVRTELKASWSTKTGFDSRDVIDQFKDGKLIAGTWVLTGYFDAGDARATVLTEKLVDAWPVTTMDAWGMTWQMRGGKYEFTGSLGAQPALVYATDRSKDYPTLLLYHFFIGEPGISGEEMVQRVKASPLSAAIVKAYRENRYGTSFPARHPAVKSRDDSVAARTVTLKKHNLQVALPDDGYIWVPQKEPEGITDFLYRLGPTFPELTLDVLVIDAPTVRAAWGSIDLSPPPAGTIIANLPDGWEVGPEVTPPSGKESTVAKQIGHRVLIVGFLANTVTTDAEPLGPILEALAESVAKKAAGN